MAEPNQDELKRREVIAKEKAERDAQMAKEAQGRQANAKSAATNLGEEIKRKVQADIRRAIDVDMAAFQQRVEDRQRTNPAPERPPLQIVAETTVVQAKPVVKRSAEADPPQIFPSSSPTGGSTEDVWLVKNGVHLQYTIAAKPV